MQFKFGLNTLALIIVSVALGLIALGGFAGYKIAAHEKEVFTPIEGNVWEYGQ